MSLPQPHIPPLRRPEGTRPPLPLARRALLVALATVLALVLCACAAIEREVCVQADGDRACFSTGARTVAEVLTVAGVSLGESDRVEPGYWDPLPPDGVVRVVRVEERTEVERQTLPFDRRSVPSLGMEPGEQRLLQPGQEGIEELAYQVTLEDGLQTDRRLASRTVLAQPVDELVAVGVEGEARAVSLAGTVTYLALGNAWVMRGSSGAARPLTLSGDLDGRVFELSPDGSTLLFSRRAGAGEEGLNSLWSVATAVTSAEVVFAGARDVLVARWSPAGTSIAYSTGERTEGSPGWRALNDLWLLGWPPASEPHLLSPGICSGPYCWWGVELAWGPGGDSLLAAEPSALRLVDLTGSNRALLAFPAARTQSTWVWVPRPAIHPSAGVVAIALHVPAEGASPEDSSRYDLALLDVEGGQTTTIRGAVGMWAQPVFSAVSGDGSVRLAYGVSLSPEESANSAYELWVADADGSDAGRLYPREEGLGARLLDFAWSPDGGSVLVVDGGDLVLCSVASRQVTPLLQGVEAIRVRWAP